MKTGSPANGRGKLGMGTGVEATPHLDFAYQGPIALTMLDRSA